MVSKDQIHSIVAGDQRNAVIVIERSEMCYQLWQDLLTADNRSAND